VCVCASVLMSFQCPRLEFPLHFTISETAGLCEPVRPLSFSQLTLLLNK